MILESDSAEAFVASASAAVGNAGAPELQLGAWEGPLDLLLELARAQRVDLAQLSIATLAEQFAAAVDAAIVRRQVPLSWLADWLEQRPQLGRNVFGCGETEPAADAPPAPISPRCCGPA